MDNPNNVILAIARDNMISRPVNEKKIKIKTHNFQQIQSDAADAAAAAMTGTGTDTGAPVASSVDGVAGASGDNPAISTQFPQHVLDAIATRTDTTAQVPASGATIADPASGCDKKRKLTSSTADMDGTPAVLAPTTSVGPPKGAPPAHALSRRSKPPPSRKPAVTAATAQ